MRDDLSALLRESTGHFEMESGHHGRRWLELETLFLRPSAVRPLVAELAARLAPYRPEVICSPLVEGAFVGLIAAEALGVDFTYAARDNAAASNGLFSVRYKLPAPLRKVVRGRRIAIVNDVVNAGSAVRGTLADLAKHDAQPAVIGTLLALGEAPRKLAGGAGLPLEALDEDANEIWPPDRCPLCAAGVPLTPHPGF